MDCATVHGVKVTHPVLMAMGQNPIPPVTSQSPLGQTKMGGAPSPKWDFIGVYPRPHGVLMAVTRLCHQARGCVRLVGGP